MENYENVLSKQNECEKLEVNEKLKKKLRLLDLLNRIVNNCSNM